MFSLPHPETSRDTDNWVRQGIKDKGKLLTALSAFWFEFLGDKCPNHLISTTDFPAEVKQHEDQLVGRSMVVKKHKIFPVEAIVRGYITGSAWAEYKKEGTVHGIKVPEGMKESQIFEKPLFTPSTKAEQGEHGECCGMRAAVVERWLKLCGR